MNVGIGVEGDGLAAADDQLLVGTDVLDSGAEQAGVECDGVFARQPQLDGDIGAVAFAGLGEGAVEEDADLRESGEAVAVVDGGDKALGGAPGT